MTDYKEPDWDQNASWNEFEWETAFKFSEQMTSKYFQMLGRYGDLPEAEEFISTKLGDHTMLAGDDEPYEELIESWEASYSENDFPPGVGDALYYETTAVFQRARQISLGWCNILSSVLSRRDRAWGLNVLLYMGRILSYLSLSIGDGTFDRVDASIAFAKRVLQQINVILGELQDKVNKSPEYKSMFKLINDHLLETHDLVITYLEECHNRKEQH